MTAAKRTPKTDFKSPDQQDTVKDIRVIDDPPAEPKGPGMAVANEGVAAAEDLEITKEHEAPEIDEETRKENIRRMYEE
jgi:hypothetical protein